MRQLGLVVLLGTAFLITGCQPQSKAKADNADQHVHPVTSLPSTTSQTAKAEQGAKASAQHIVVYKSPTCGCCNDWISHLQAEGFHVEAINQTNMGEVKARLGVPHGMGSCHTAQIEGYVIEGHVPAADIQRLLKEKPKARGLTVPGMPLGSPGMEMGDTREPYTVYLIHTDGTTTVWSEHAADLAS